MAADGRFRERGRQRPRAPERHLPGGLARTFDPQADKWSIWWLDGRNPSGLDPPVVGGFKDGIGTFIAEDTFDGRPILVRFLWSDITDRTCRWEQAFSPDGGETWEVNWIMESTRIALSRPAIRSRADPVPRSRRAPPGGRPPFGC